MSSPHSIKSAARKLPIKRKSPDPSPSQSQNPNLNLTPKSEDDEDEFHHHDLKPPPFKFHRIWTEPDEIRFLQGLLDSSTSHNYIFPRDLHLFYDGFSTSMSQPYTKSQLSEKLRRLRRKYRLISSRISHGLDPSRLSNHDQSLFEISQKLWDPNSNSNSPFAKKGNNASNSVSVEVSFNPSFTPAKTASVPVSVLVDDEDESFEELSDGVNIISSDCDNHIRSVVSKTVMDVFDKCVEEAKSSCSDTSNTNVLSWLGKEGELVQRIREQRIAELDVVAQRMSGPGRDAREHGNLLLKYRDEKEEKNPALNRGWLAQNRKFKMVRIFVFEPVPSELVLPSIIPLLPHWQRIKLKEIKWWS